MNRYRFIAVLSIVLAYLWAASNDANGMGEIEDPDTPGREQASLRLLNNRAIGRLGGAYYWAVKANEDWQVDDMELPEWLSFDPISGEAGITSVTLTADTLFTDEAREAVLTFLMATDTVDITVQQLAEGEIPMDETLCRFADTRVFGVEGGVLKRTLQAADTWSLAVAEGREWLQVSPLQGEAGETELTFTATASDGIIRVAVLQVNVADTVIELAVTQNLNQTRPQMSVTKEAEVVGRTAALGGKCKFYSDELEMVEVGFAYRLESESEWTNFTVIEVVDAEIVFEFADTVRDLKAGKTYVYAPYGVVSGSDEKTYGEEFTFETEGRVPPTDGVWYYESFDGMYDAGTGTYAQAAIDKNYSFYTNADFEQGFVKQNQPTASYQFSPFRIDLANNTNAGFISAYIQPEGNALGWQFPSWATPDTQFYEGASGNWKAVSSYKANWSCTISDLDFEGAPMMQLSFGCYSDKASPIEIPSLKVLISEDGTNWKELPISYNAAITNEKRWRHVVADNIPNTTVAIRIQLADSSRVFAIDDIKVVEKN